jgi:hypothetical protein
LVSYSAVMDGAANTGALVAASWKSSFRHLPDVSHGSSSSIDVAMRAAEVMYALYQRSNYVSRNCQGWQKGYEAAK